MRALTLIFVILIAALQYPLWLGKGSWLRVWDLSRQISEQKDKNAVLKARNDTLDAEVRDLKQGYAAIEERARNELGMVKQDEVFYQIIERTGQNASPNPSQTTTQDSKTQNPTQTPDRTSTTQASKSP
ncbi:MAG: cell division protein FtsB [Methylophilaceae bacterium]|nr:cell division protein FtsB [Methyloradius sp.]